MDHSEGGRSVEASPTFLTVTTLHPFLSSATTAVKQFLENSRRRFSTSIESRIPSPGILEKRYPLGEEGRALNIRIPFRNLGPGNAVYAEASVEFSEDCLYSPSPTIVLGDIRPGPFSIFVEVLVVSACTEITCMVELTWHEAGSTDVKRLPILFRILAQRADINWKAYEFQRPYSTEVAKGEAFVGRRERVNGLANHLLSNPCESFYITGQKRIGKTSLALAAGDFAKQNSGGRLETLYILWGAIQHEDARASLKALGNAITDFLVGFLPIGTPIPTLDFEGSLAPLTRLLQLLMQKAPDKTFLIVLDEFDEIHPELYRQGQLAETFFANLRAIGTIGNVGFVLVGGENMPFVMDRQGQRLNKFVKEPLDYFSRDREWGDYMELVRKPVESYLNWHEAAIQEVYNTTNGNPYFTNILCAGVSRDAIQERDADISLHEVERAIERQTASFDTNSFAHLWQDGIPPSDEKVVEEIRRCRVLVAIARTLRRGEDLTLEKVIGNKNSGMLSDLEIFPVLNDFCRRGILREKSGTYQFTLPLFQQWLVQIGMELIIADKLGDEIAAAMQNAEDAAFVHVNEIADVARSWPIYQGRQIGSEDIRSWLNQVQSQREQRLLFTLLKTIRFFGEIEVRALLKSAYSIVRQQVPLVIQRKRSDRRNDILVTYVDGEGKSGQYYAGRFAEENGISTKAILAQKGFGESATAFEKATEIPPSAIVIVDDIIGTGKTLADNVAAFVTENKIYLETKKVPVIVVALTATSDGEEKVRSRMAKLPIDNIDLRVCEPLPPRHEAFSRANDIWRDQDEYDRAKALCADWGAKIYWNNPLGFGGQGLLVVFPQTCPNNSLPILHSGSRGTQQWKPLFQRLVN